jgi:hypothetical protein
MYISMRAGFTARAIIGLRRGNPKRGNFEIGVYQM